MTYWGVTDKTNDVLISEGWFNTGIKGAQDYVMEYALKFQGDTTKDSAIQFSNVGVYVLWTKVIATETTAVIKDSESFLSKNWLWILLLIAGGYYVMTKKKGRK